MLYCILLLQIVLLREGYFWFAEDAFTILLFHPLGFHRSTEMIKIKTQSSNNNKRKLGFGRQGPKCEVYRILSAARSSEPLAAVMDF